MAVAGPAPELRAGPLVFVEDIEAPDLDGGDVHHLRRSLRLVDGAPFCVADGGGRWRTAVLGAAGAEGLGPVRIEPAGAPEVAVGLAIPKGSRLEVAVAKLTEVGVDRIILVAAERSVVRWPPSEVSRRIDRLQRVVREAAMQSRRTRLPVLEGVATVAEVLSSSEAGVALAEPGGPPPGLDRSVVLVGPEGGWSSAELAAGAATVGLGPTVLRVETAAIAVGVALCAQRSAWLRPVVDHHSQSFL